MDVLTFSAQVVNAVVWPLVVFFIFYIIREQIKTLILSIREVSWKDFALIIGNVEEACNLMHSENEQDIHKAQEKLDNVLKIVDNSALYKSLLIHGSKEKENK